MDPPKYAGDNLECELINASQMAPIRSHENEKSFNEQREKHLRTFNYK